MPELLDQYQALKTRAGFLNRGNRIRVLVTGPDRVKFLHNLTTNDVKRLAPGAGHESFVTSPQGKTLGYITLSLGEDDILLRTDPGGDRLAIPHLQKYGIFDDVVIEDLSLQTFEYHVAGPEADMLVAALGAELPGPGLQSHGLTSISGVPVRLIREAPTGLPGLTLIGPADQGERILAELQAQATVPSLPEVENGVYEALRIEAGTPVFDADVVESNLPQEIGRDAHAISFVKGCYLGQETVARLDALGHVNKIMKGARFLSPDPIAATQGELKSEDGKSVGRLTSIAYSPGWRCAVALGMIRVSHAKEGTELICEVEGTPYRVVVSALPMSPPVG